MYCERARPCRSDDKTNRLPVVRAGDFSLNASQIIDVLFFTYVVRADVSSSLRRPCELAEVKKRRESGVARSGFQVE